MTFYPFDFYEQRGSSSSGVTKYYFFGGERFAMRSGTGVANGLRLLYKDRISSTVHVTDQNGNFVGSTGYYAFGATSRSSGTIPTDHRFTDQPLDGTGLYYYGARYYDPNIGQFLSPDTLVPDPTNVMDYQRYAYARGNPLKYTDPSGHCVLSTVAGPAGLVVDVPCWSSGAGEAAVAVAGAALVVSASSVPIVMWVLDDPGPNYPAPETAGDIDTAGETFPYPSSTTTSIPIPGVQMNTEADTVVPGEVVYDSSETAILADPPAGEHAHHIVAANDPIVQQSFCKFGQVTLCWGGSCLFADGFTVKWMWLVNHSLWLFLQRRHRVFEASGACRNSVSVLIVLADQRAWGLPRQAPRPCAISTC